MKKALAIFTILFVTILSTGLNPAENHTNAAESFKLKHFEIGGNSNTYKNVQDDIFYFYCTIDGIYSKERYAFISKIMKYPGYKASGKTPTDYKENVADGFRDHLKANYQNQFPYNVNNVITWDGLLTKYGSQSLKSNQDAITDKNYWISKQKRDGNTITEVNYAFYNN